MPKGRSYQPVNGSRYGVVRLAILDLRSKGWSYNKIVKELGCSKGTVAYHCGPGQKEKNVERTRKYRANRMLFI